MAPKSTTCADKRCCVLVERFSRVLAVPKVLQRGPPHPAPWSSTRADKLCFALTACLDAAVGLAVASAASSLAAAVGALAVAAVALGGGGLVLGVAGPACWRGRRVGGCRLVR